MRESLEQFEGRPWAAAPVNSSGVVLRCHALRKVPLELVRAGDLKVPVIQFIDTERLVPLALAILSGDPFVERDYYVGDLLTALLRLPRSHCIAHIRDRGELQAIATRSQAELQHGSAKPSDVELIAEIEAFLEEPDD